MIFSSHFSHPKFKRREFVSQREGSVLLLTLMVVSILLVLVLSFMVMVRLELAGLSLHQQKMQARLNAKLGMELAMGHLQKLAGPDQRATARGELFSNDSSNISGLEVPAGNQKMIAVWDSRSYDEESPEDHASAGFLGWLSSGMSEGASPSFTEAAPQAGDADSILMVGPGSVALSSDYIYARRIEHDHTVVAWVVDDEGLKAQLGNRTPDEVVLSPSGGGVLPSAFDYAVLEGMSDLVGADFLKMNRMNSLDELSLLGAPVLLSSEKYYDYTFRSTGVLSDAKNGGLKGDLTLAFENDVVFDRVFPDTDQDKYLLIDDDKLSTSTDLQTNGYIHWHIFRDYYNLKRTIQERNNTPFIDSHFFSKKGLVEAGFEEGAARGVLAPHQMGRSTMPEDHLEQPYGDIEIAVGTEVMDPLTKHNHVGPILSFMQQNAWVEYVAPPTPADSPTLTTYVQLWTGFYNPYNIGLMVRGQGDGGGAETGPRLIKYPQVHFKIPDFPELNVSDPGEFGLNDKRETNDRDPLLLNPGLNQVFGMEGSGVQTDMIDGWSIFGPDIRTNINNAYVETPYALAAEPSAENHEVTVTFRTKSNLATSMAHGVDWFALPGAPNDMEISQIMYAPFAWDPVDGFAGKVITKQIHLNDMTENVQFSAGFFLRTSRESSNDELRPLIDGNIRAPWINPRWDSPLALNTAAIYSNSSSGIPDHLLPPMQSGGGGTGLAYWGASHQPPFGATRVILFDVPREDLVSLGQLQHAAAGRFSYEPSYIVGNSYANPRISQDVWRESVSDTFSITHGLSMNRIAGDFNLYDASYLVNQEMWDAYVFTTIPQVKDNYTPGEAAINYAELQNKERSLPNPRYIPYEPSGSTFTASVLTNTGNSSGTSGAYFYNAGHVLVDGAFNVNSTSVDAWEAFLTGTLGVAVQGIDEEGQVIGFKSVDDDRVRFPRVKSVLGDGMDTTNLDDNYWIGFRELTQDEVRELASEIVSQVKRRGPFLNMGQFVNRYLRTDDLGAAGSLQAALNATVNKDLDSDFALDAGGISADASQGAGFPGQLLQGDLLQALSPLMQVRSDTFKIRAYGEYKNGNDVARAWCEAEVQRVPDPVVPTTESYDLYAELASPQSPFGRQFRIVSFRWLSEDEI
ncbi:hypothetical protein P3T73_11470 [Kiritimatiellota bacterium B12222]|nr:hypothetical protein P3T73_11470 [Kiritimatiellota bacterium B12222]